MTDLSPDSEFADVPLHDEHENNLSSDERKEGDEQNAEETPEENQTEVTDETNSPDEENKIVDEKENVTVKNQLPEETNTEENQAPKPEIENNDQDDSVVHEEEKENSNENAENSNTLEDPKEESIETDDEVKSAPKLSLDETVSRSSPMPETPKNDRKMETKEEESDEEEQVPSRIVSSLENLQPDGDLRKPIEELIEQTLAENPIYNSREALLNEEDPHALIFWGKTISTHAKRMKAHFLRKRKQDKSDEESFQWSSNQIVMVYINFHASAIDKFLLASTLDPMNSFVDINATSIVSTSAKRKKETFPTMELCYEWGLASLRYGKALETQKDFHASYAQYDTAAKLFMRVIQEDRRRKWTQRAMNKLVVVFECLAKVKPSSSDVRSYCDIFLVQFSNIAMRGEMKELSLKPLIAMCLTESRHVREARAIDVIRHLATFFSSNIASEATEQLQHLESILERTENKDALISRLSTAAKKRLESSGLKREDYIEHVEVLVNILQWKGKPPCRLSYNYTKFGDTIESWKQEDPRKLYTEKHRVSSKEAYVDLYNELLVLTRCNRNRKSYVFIAKRKADRIPVTIKVFTKWSENEKAIKKEVALLSYMNQHENFTKLLDVFLHNDEVWAIVEYCDAGNLVDFIPVSEMTEYEMAYIAREVLKALNFLHSNNRMHRDLTTDDILLNMSGDVLVSDFELWMGNNLQRYWLSPELLLSEPYPYGPEVDIWSLGCIIMEMADGYPPYSEMHPIKEFFYTATQGAPPLANPKKWSVELKRFLEDCLHPDPSKRASAEKLLADPWIQKACSRQKFSEDVQLRISWTRW